MICSTTPNHCVRFWVFTIFLWKRPSAGPVCDGGKTEGEPSKKVETKQAYRGYKSRVRWSLCYVLVGFVALLLLLVYEKSSVRSSPHHGYPRKAECCQV